LTSLPNRAGSRAPGCDGARTPMGPGLRCPTIGRRPAAALLNRGDDLGYDALEIATCVAQRRLPARMRPGNIVARTAAMSCRRVPSC
jgi:hypothetical protein